MMRIAQAPALERTSSEAGAVSQEGMRGMGYAGSASVSVVLPEPASPSTLPTPAENLDEHYAVWAALAQSDRGKVDLAIAGLQQVVAKNPRHSFAHSLLGEMLLEAKKPRKAIAVLSAMIELELDRPGLRRNLALAHAMLGEFKQALEHARAFEEFCPGDPQAAEFRRAIEKRQAEGKGKRPGGN
jgi:predicted Zn-dependent protease